MSSELAEGPGRGGAQKNPGGSTASARPAVSPGGLHSLGTVAGTSSGRVSALPPLGHGSRWSREVGAGTANPRGAFRRPCSLSRWGWGVGDPQHSGPRNPGQTGNGKKSQSAHVNDKSLGSPTNVSGEKREDFLPRDATQPPTTNTGCAWTSLLAESVQSGETVQQGTGGDARGAGTKQTRKNVWEGNPAWKRDQGERKW